MRTANRRKSDYIVLALCELFGFCWMYLYFSIQCTSMKIVIWVVWLELQIKCGWACLECWYWECLLLRCKCICVVKPCLCRECKSFYSLVPIENACWHNLSAFTFSASLPVKEFMDYILCMHTFPFLGSLHVQEKNEKKKISSGNRVPLGKTEQNRATSRAEQSI